jgi:hypothetical protein
MRNFRIGLLIELPLPPHQQMTAINFAMQKQTPQRTKSQGSSSSMKAPRYAIDRPFKP